MKKYGIRIRCLTPDNKQDNKLFFDNECVFYSYRLNDGYKGEDVFFLGMKAGFVKNLVTDIESMRVYTVIGKAKAKAKRMQDWFDKVICDNNLSCKFAVDIIEMRITIHELDV